jgi:Ulp1 family protease
VNFRGCKYSKELIDFPPISLECFQRIMDFWKEKKRVAEIKKTRMESVEKLTYKAMGCLEHKEWLNDDVVNISIELLEKQLPKEGVKLMNTYFATTTLAKNENMINRFLKKKGVDRSHFIIMPINSNSNHWIFACFSPQQHILTVYDSLRRPAEQYRNNPIFQNAIKFTQWFYQA